MSILNSSFFVVKGVHVDAHETCRKQKKPIKSGRLVSGKSTSSTANSLMKLLIVASGCSLQSQRPDSLGLFASKPFIYIHRSVLMQGALGHAYTQVDGVASRHFISN